MANIAHDKRYGTLSIRFRYGGKYYKRALRSTNNRHANAMLARVEETLGLIRRGRLVVPENVDPADFVLADGLLQSPVVHEVPGNISLKEFFEAYDQSLPDGAKEASTLKTELTHRKHLLKHIGARTIVRTIDRGTWQSGSRWKDRSS